MTKTESRGRKLPDQDTVAAALMAQASPAVHTHVAGRTTIHYVARHADCMAMLRGEHSDHLSAAHYDALMRSATKGRHGTLDFLLGEGEDKTARWAILSAALNHPPSIDRRDGSDFAPYARAAVQDAVREVRVLRGPDGRFDGVADYARIAAAVASARFTGLELPLPGKSLKKRAARFMLLSQGVFGQAFANIGDRSTLLRIIARLTTGAFRKLIARSLDTPSDGSLLARLEAVRPRVQAQLQLSDAEYERHRDALVYEISGTIQLLVTTSFANLLDAAHQADITPAQLSERIEQDGLAVIDEALRLVPTTPQLYRFVESDFEFAGRRIARGDHVCALVGAAMRDPDVFPLPDRFASLRDPELMRAHTDYLNFGPNEAEPNELRPTDGTHPCFGQYWARHLLAAMVKGLAAYEGVTVAGPATRKMGLPASLPMVAPFDAADIAAARLERGQRQGIVTVLTEIRAKDGLSQSEAEAEVQRRVERLGNPVRDDYARALRSTDCIHFCSLTVVPGRKRGEPSYLVLEMSADGSERDALAALCSVFSEPLWHVYAATGAIAREGQLLDHLQDSSIDLVQSPWPSFLSGKARNGLGFNGKPGLSQPRVLAEAKLAEEARTILEAAPAHETPLQSLHRVRDALDARKGEDRALLWPMMGSRPPVFAEDRNSPWVNMPKGGGAAQTALAMAPKLFPRPLLPVFALAFLGVLALVHAVMFPGAFPQYSCGDGCVGLPPWLDEAWPADIGEARFRLSLRNLAFSIGLAIGVALLANLVASGLRRALRPVRSFGFSRMGSVVGFSAAFALFAGLISLQHRYGVQIHDALDRPDLALFALGTDQWIVVGIVSLALLYYAVARRGLRWNRFAFAALGTVATATLFTLVAHQQWLVFSDQLPSPVVNRWGAASLATLIFYPLIFAVGLVTAALGLVRSWPALDAPLLRVTPLAAGLGLAALIFVTSFFTLGEVGAWLSDWRSWGLAYVVAPALIASLLAGGYAWLTRSTSGRRSTPRGWIAVTAALSALTALIVSAPGWAGPATAGVLISLGVAVPLYILLVGLALGALALAIRASEKRNVFTDQEPETENIAAIMARENRASVQNHMTSVVRIIPSTFRKRITLPLALRIVREGLENQAYRPGFLGSVGTVQYARWIHLPRTNNYVFYSNYDGSFESYLEDFITKASFGMTGVWSNSVGFPNAKLLFLEGSEDGDRFKRYARGSMIPTPFWFSAYPHLSSEQIRRNALIRDGLARIETASDAAAWLDLFGSVSRPETVIEDAKVQSIVFSGNGKLKEGACIAVVPSPRCHPQAFRDWLCAVSEHVTYGDTAPQTRATYVSLSRRGLELLGLGSDVGCERPWTGADEHLGGTARTLFPPAFAMGMHHPSRRFVLGDEDEDKPDRWDWGSGEREAAAAVFVYGSDVEAFETELAARLTELAPICEPTPDQIIRFDSLAGGELREPFGFADGISQPRIAGTSQLRSRHERDALHRVEPGEFILGYRDNRDRFPPSPQVEAVRDLANDLPAPAAEQPLRYPRFAGDAAALRRDLGRNGSYLVIRQLEQDVELFHQTSVEMAAALRGDTCPHELLICESPSCKPRIYEPRTYQTAAALQAKMVGRWRDGQSLEQNPIRLVRERTKDGETTELEWRLDHEPEMRPENDFLFGANDPQGDLCPFGSHIRRAFPRDGLDPDNPDSLAIANRHRLLRRGRSYRQMRGNTEARGTFFVCLNADIERQFEFVQQSWIGSPKFHSLTDEVDPITAQGVSSLLTEDPDKARWVTDGLPFTIQAGGREHRLNGLKKFVTLRGGGYFFLPSRDALRFLCRG